MQDDHSWLFKNWRCAKHRTFGSIRCSAANIYLLDAPTGETWTACFDTKHTMAECAIPIDMYIDVLYVGSFQRLSIPIYLIVRPFQSILDLKLILTKR